MQAMRFVIPTALALLVFYPAVPAAAQSGPSVLVVTAHPDDEAVFAATAYRITHDLRGIVDLALITDGAGGYRFSVLAEDLYGLELTDPEVASAYLPTIRKRELMAAGDILGLRKYFFLDQPDLGRTNDPDSILAHVWDVNFVAGQLDRILAAGSYDFVFTHLPIPAFHSHHKAATILAIQAVSRMPADEQPVILGSLTSGGTDGANDFVQLAGHPETRIVTDSGPFTFDRSTKLGLDDRLDYSIIVDWLIAEYKSQGTMQNFLGDAGLERFWVYEMNSDGAVEKADALLRAVREAPVPR